MKIKKNNKGFALAEILAVTLVMMVIFTVLYSNFMPLSGEYARSENYNDISSQYELHYFRKLFQEYITDEALQQQANNEISTNKYILLIGHDTNGNEKSCDSLAGTNKDICTNLKAKLNPTLILTNYNISSLKNELKKDTNKLPDLRTYILSLPDYNDRDNQQEIYRLIIKTNSGYANVKLKYEKDDIRDVSIDSTLSETYTSSANFNVQVIGYYFNSTVAMNIIAGSDGLLKFYMQVPMKPTGNYYGIYKVTMNNELVLNSYGRTGLTSTYYYSINAVKGQTYRLVADFRTNSNNSTSDIDYGTAYLYSFTLPEKSVIIPTSNTGYYKGQFAGGTRTWNYKVNNITNKGVMASSNYKQNEETKKYELIDPTITGINEKIIGKYICNDAKSTVCDTLYEIKEASTKITKVKNIQ